MSEDAIDLLSQPGQPTASRTVDPDIKVQTGRPPFETRAGGPSGRSKYQPIFDAVNNGIAAGTLAPDLGWVEVLGDEKKLAHLRTALKRQGRFNPDVVKVSHLDKVAKTKIAIFIPKDADMTKLNDVKDD